jgi:hypothetical protein
MPRALELAEGVTFRGRGVRLERWEGGWGIRLGKISCQVLPRLAHIGFIPKPLIGVLN